MRLKVAVAATGSVGATTAPSTNAAAQLEAVDQRVGGDGDGAHRRQHEPDGEQHQRPQLGAQLARRGVKPAEASSGGRKTRKTTSGSTLDLGQAGHERRSPRPTSTSAIGYGMCSQAASRTSAAAPSSSRKRNSRSATSVGESTIGRCPTSLDPPLGPDDHVPARADAPLRARHVRRLRVPVLRGLAVDPRARARAPERAGCASPSATSRSRTSTRRAGTRPRPPRRRPPRARSGRCTTRSTPRAAGLADADLVAPRARARARRRARRAPSSPPAPTRPRVERDAASARALGISSARRPSSSTASARRRLRRGLARRRPARIRASLEAEGCQAVPATRRTPDEVAR